MTREEAIQVLRDWDGYFIGHGTGDVTEALDMAIEELKKEPCEDCISKQEVLDKITQVCFSKDQKWIDFRSSYGSNGQRDLIIKFIESLEPVTSKTMEITLDDVQRYCKARCLTIITNELLYDLTHITCRRCGTFLLEKNGLMICPACLWIKPTKQEESED